MELHDVPANVRLQGAVVVRQIGQGHGPGADGATARTSGADPPRPGDLGLRRADCLHSSRFSTRTPLFVTVSIAAYCRRCRARLVCRRCSNCSVVCWGRLGLPWCPVWVVHFLGTSFGNDFLGFRRNKGILLRQSDATSILIWFLNPEKTKISRKSRDRMHPLHPRQDARRCRGREHDGHGPLLRPSRPGPWCSRVDERDDAPPAPPGSASAPGGLDVHLKPPPQGSLSGAVWRVDRGR